jgi:hypothetical protein
LRNFWLLSIFQFRGFVEVITKMTVSLIQDRIADMHQTCRDIGALVQVLTHDYMKRG